MRNRSLINWGIILLILIGSGVLTILLPALFSGSAAVALPSEVSRITVPLPLPIGGRSEVSLAAWQWMLGLALLVPGLVIGAGLTLGIVNILIARLVTSNAANADNLQRATALQKRQDERIKTMRQARPTSRAPEATWRRWSVFTTAVIILMFVGFGALLLAGLLFPEGPTIRQGSIVNTGSLLVLASLAIALVTIVVRLRADRIEALDRSDALSIPWDAIAVVITGLLVVGLGIAIIAILNAPQ